MAENPDLSKGAQFGLGDGVIQLPGGLQFAVISQKLVDDLRRPERQPAVQVEHGIASLAGGVFRSPDLNQIPVHDEGIRAAVWLEFPADSGAGEQNPRQLAVPAGRVELAVRVFRLVRCAPQIARIRRNQGGSPV